MAAMQIKELSAAEKNILSRTEERLVSQLSLELGSYASARANRVIDYRGRMYAQMSDHERALEVLANPNIPAVVVQFNNGVASTIEFSSPCTPGIAASSFLREYVSYGVLAQEAVDAARRSGKRTFCIAAPIIRSSVDIADMEISSYCQRLVYQFVADVTRTLMPGAGAGLCARRAPTQEGAITMPARWWTER